MDVTDKSIYEFIGYTSLGLAYDLDVLYQDCRKMMNCTKAVKQNRKFKLGIQNLFALLGKPNITFFGLLSESYTQLNKRYFPIAFNFSFMPNRYGFINCTYQKAYHILKNIRLGKVHLLTQYKPFKERKEGIDYIYL